MKLAMPSLRQIRIEQARRHLLPFIKYTNPGYIDGWFHRITCQELDSFLSDVVAKRSPRLMILAPPRHGKSEMASRRFPAFALGKHPDLSIIGTSYAGDLASSMNRDTQRIIESEEFAEVFPETRMPRRGDAMYKRGSDIFEIVGHKGVYRSAGRGGGITGKGGEILLIDDPLKDMEEALSDTIRNSLWDWYTSTLYTRRAPGAGILVMLTRWHHDDLAGRLLKAMRQGGEQWKVVEFPAIAEKDEEHRAKGEALHEDRFPLSDLLNTKTTVGSYVWGALYQQHPSPLEGGIIQTSWFKRYKVLPEEFALIFQSWDTAQKEKDANDPSACTTWGVTEEGNIYLIDVHNKRMLWPELRRTAESLAMKHNPSVVLIEDKSSGTSLVQDLQEHTNIPVLPIEPEGDKVIRAMAVSPLIEAGRVFLPEAAPWLVDYETEIAAFPTGEHDDSTDSTTQALKYFHLNRNTPAFIRGLKKMGWKKKEK